MIRQLHLIGFLLATFASGGLARNPAIVCGHVFDSQTLTPLPGATIMLGPGRGTASSEEGNFRIDLTAGDWQMTVYYMGYSPESRQISLGAGDSLFLRIGLDPVPTGMDQVVVSASRMEQRVSESAVSVSMIRPASLSAVHLTDPKDIMNKLSAIEVLDGQASIRGGSGFSYGAGSRVLALVDGLPMISADAGSIRWQTLPLENISQIEVIKGASSVLYGSSALNGIVNFRTADPPPVPQSRFFAESGLYARPRNRDWIWWDKPQRFRKASLSHAGQYGRTGLNMGVFLLDDQGYRRLNDERLLRMNARMQRHSRRFEGVSYGAAINGGYSDKRDFFLWEDARTGALKQNEEVVSHMKGRFLYIDPFAGIARENGFSHDWRSRIQLTENRYPVTVQNNSSTRSVYSEYQLDGPLGRGLSLNAGLVFHRSQVCSNFYGNHDALNLSVYSQLGLPLGGRLNLVAGLRLEHNSLNGEADHPVPLFRAGLNYRLSDSRFLRASYGMGYRVPSIAEKYARTSLGVVQIVPNPHLKPESGWNAEVGLKQGLLTPALDGVIDLTLFYIQNKDLIEYLFGYHSGAGFGFRAVNQEYSRVTGAELEFLFTHSKRGVHTSLQGGYVWMLPVEFDQRNWRNTGNYLKYRRKHSAALNLITARGPWEAGIGLHARSRILEIDDVFLLPQIRERILPGFYDYWMASQGGHIRADVHLARSLGAAYRISLVLHNVTNAEIMGRPGDIQPQRQFGLRFAGEF